MEPSATPVALAMLRDLPLRPLACLSLALTLCSPREAIGGLRAVQPPVAFAAWTPLAAVVAGPARATVVVDAQAVPEDAAALADRVRGKLDLTLRDADVLPAAGPDDAEVRVTIGPRPGGELGFVYGVVVVRGGAEIEGSRREGACDLCTEGELIEQLTPLVAGLVPSLSAPAEPPVPASTGADDPAEEAAPPVDAPPAADARDRGRAPLGSLGKSGVGLIAGGAAVLIAGVVVALLPDRRDDVDPSKLRDYGPPGWALVAVGASAVAVGIPLLVVDRRRARAAGPGRSASAAALRLGAWAAGGAIPGAARVTAGADRRAGLVLHGRF